MTCRSLIIFFISLGATMVYGDVSIISQIDQAEIPETQARLELAKALNASEQISEAVAQYNAIIKERPDMIEAKQELAQIYAAQNKTNEAKILILSIPKEKVTKQVKRTLASIYETETRFEDAQKIYEEILGTDEHDQVTRFRLAEVLAWQKKYDNAIVQFELLSTQRPKDIQLLRHYAQVLGWAKRYKEAVKIWERTLPPLP